MKKPPPEKTPPPEPTPEQIVKILDFMANPDGAEQASSARGARDRQQCVLGLGQSENRDQGPARIRADDHVGRRSSSPPARRTERSPSSLSRGISSRSFSRTFACARCSSATLEPKKMIKHLLSSATFSPPDDLGSGSGETVSADHDQGGSTEPAGAPSEFGLSRTVRYRSRSSGQTARRDDYSECAASDLGDEIKGRCCRTGTKATQAPEIVAGCRRPCWRHSLRNRVPSPQPTAVTATAPQATSGPPQTWSKEERAIWNDLPEAARATINRREAASARGVHELRSRYQEIDTAVAPYSAVMKQNNVTAGQAINKLFAWHMELAGPNKVAAFRQLAQNFGVDLASPCRRRPVSAAAAASISARQPGYFQSRSSDERL